MQEQERNYQREYELSKNKDKIIGIRISVDMAKDFESKCDLNGISKNALIKKWIENYTYNCN